MDHRPSPSSSSTKKVRLDETRIRDVGQGSIGTICYVGPVETTIRVDEQGNDISSNATNKKLYYGIRWDDPSRGRHNGSVVVTKITTTTQSGENDVDDARTTSTFTKQYFDAQHPTSGSFVVAKKVDFGIPFSKGSVEQRYRRLLPNAPQENQPQVHMVSTTSGKGKVIEFVGQDKILRQQQWEHLQHLSLRNMGISTIPLPLHEAEEDTSTGHSDNNNNQDNRTAMVARARHHYRELQHISSIDLAGNLLYDWNELFHLLAIFPNLEQVSLASNRMVDSSLTSLTSQEFPKLHTLNFRNCNIGSWETVLTLVRSFPNLKELCVAYARLPDLMELDDVTSSFDTLCTLETLDVTGCGLSSPQKVQSLARWCPNLLHLSLNDNPLEAWPLSSDVQLFPKLQSVQLAETKVSKWNDILPLVSSCPDLRSLRLQQCPLTDRNGGTTGQPAHAVRSCIIAAFPALQQWNASSIAADRADAERHYLVLHFRNQQEQGTDGNDFLVVSPERYQELNRRYPDILSRQKATSDAAPSSSSLLLANSVVTVTIKSFAAQSCTMDPLIRKLPLRLTVGRVKALCARSFGLDIDLQVLQYSNPSRTGTSLPIDMDSDVDSLEECGIMDGAEIIMKEIDLEEVERQKQRREEELLRRVEQQQEERKQFERQKEQQRMSHVA